MNHHTLYVYPCYIDKSSKPNDGRKMPLLKCVEKPTAKELLAASIDLGFKTEIHEQKRHPKDYWRFGRIAVSFYMESDDPKAKFPLNPRIHDRRDLYAALSERIIYNRENKVETPASKQKKGKGK